MSGVLHGVLASLKSAVTVVTDAFFEYVSLLLNTTTTNGAQNNTFLDSSTNAFSVTRNGNTTQGNFSPFSQTGWSNYFDGTGDFLSVATNAAFDLGSSDFTIEAWVNPNSFTNGYAVASRYNFSGSASGWALRFVNATTLRFIRGNDVILDATVSASVGVWYHVAVVRNGSTLTIYLNGTQVAQATGIANFTDATTALQIGRTNTATDDANGYTSNLRIVKGTAVYTSNFTPPTSPLTAITNTSLLTCQSNRFLDNSSNAFAITRNGDVSVQAFSPFNPTAAWSASTNGGSGYFDGTGDNLSAASNSAFDILSGGDFTVECWFYATALTDNSGFGAALVSRDNTASTAGFIFRVRPTALEFVYPGVAGNSQAFTFVTNTWYHVAAVRSSGTMRYYINGTQYSPTYTDRTTDSATALVTGASSYTVNTAPFTGYISNLRIVKGTAVYTANFTPPTAPLTAIANTSLLLNFTNAGIYDSASGNDLETVGNAQVSTVQAKWGTTSMAFDGTGDSLTAIDSPRLELGAADFTIELWAYYNAVGGASGRGTLSKGSTTGASFLIFQGATNELAFYASSNGTTWDIASAVQFSSNIPLNTWHHLAVTRSRSSFRVFLNGTQTNTFTSTASLVNNTAPVTVGAYGSLVMDGYIDDLRITNGYARYGFFTPPTSALTATAYTGLLANTTTTNGAQNNTFLDGSTNNFSITRNGNTTQGSFSPFSNSGWSNYFDGTGDYLTVPDNAAFTLGSGNFTVEAWIYNGTTGARKFICGQGDSGGFQSTISIGVEKSAANKLRGIVCSGSAEYAAVSTADLPLNQWVHVAFVRNGNTGTLYINGTADGTVNLTGITANDSTNLFAVGALGQLTSFTFEGYISNARVVKGTAVYTANFTPPTSPLTAITNTSLLTCQSNRFIDNSTNNFTITRNGDTSVQAFSPFTPATYSTSTNGGSGYFDGTGDYLAAPDNAAFEFGNGDYTTEAWVYLTGYSANYAGSFAGVIFAKNSSNADLGFYLILNGTASSWTSVQVVQYYSGATNESTTATSTLLLNTWYHIAATRSSGSVRIFINGVQANTTATFTQTQTNTTASFTVGGQNFPTYTYNLPGYISDARVVKGTAVYTANFTPPTAPLTAIANTSLLLNFTNAGIFDAAGANNFETVGNAQVSTTQAKYGTTSMYFDGTGDYLTSPNWPNLNMGSANFTVECWIYFPSAITTTKTIVDKDGKSAVSWPQYALQITSASKAYAIISTTTTSAPPGSPTTSITGATTLNTNMWYHIALTRVGTNATLWVNGVADGTTSAVPATLNTRNAPLFVGYGDSAVTTTQFNGYIQDLRITNGQALYTTNFTPPTAPFPVQ